MGEMLDAVSDAAASDHGPPGDGDGGNPNGGKCLVLFPTEDAKTFHEIKEDIWAKRGTAMNNLDTQMASRRDSAGGDLEKGWDVVVIDGTWSQARKMHAKYFPRSGGRLHRVQLSEDAVRALDRPSPSSGLRGGDGGVPAGVGDVGRGHQLRKHPIKVRDVASSIRAV